MGNIQIITLITSVAFLLQVIVFTAKNRLNDRQSFIWLILAIGGVLIAALLPLLNKLANFIGISYMPTLIFMAGFFIVLSILVYQTIVISDMQNRQKRLIQELAILSKELRETREKDFDELR